MISTSHQNAAFYFERDVNCVQTYFSKNYGLVFEGKPTLDDENLEREIDLDKEVRASGFIKEELGKGKNSAAAIRKAFDEVADNFLEKPTDE